MVSMVNFFLFFFTIKTKTNNILMHFDKILDVNTEVKYKDDYKCKY